MTPLSFPIIKSENKGFVPSTVNIGNRQIPVETLTNIDAMARRQLKDQMPGILLRTTIRAVLKSLAQDQANKGGLVLGLVSNVAAVVSEQADDRSWRTLPERISVARATLPVGVQTLEIQTDNGILRKEVEIGNRFTIVPIRLSGGAAYVGKYGRRRGAGTGRQAAIREAPACQATAQENRIALCPQEIQ